MIDLVISWLRHAGVDFGFFRLMDYPTFRALMGMATALGLSLMLGFRIIVMLYRDARQTGPFRPPNAGRPKGVTQSLRLVARSLCCCR